MQVSITQQYVWGVVIVSALALINLVTWSGYAWVMWPAGALRAWTFVVSPPRERPIQ